MTSPQLHVYQWLTDLKNDAPGRFAKVMAVKGIYSLGLSWPNTFGMVGCRHAYGTDEFVTGLRELPI